MITFPGGSVFFTNFATIKQVDDDGADKKHQGACTG